MDSSVPLLPQNQSSQSLHIQPGVLAQVGPGGTAGSAGGGAPNRPSFHWCPHLGLHNSSPHTSTQASLEPPLLGSLYASAAGMSPLGPLLATFLDQNPPVMVKHHSCLQGPPPPSFLLSFTSITITSEDPIDDLLGVTAPPGGSRLCCTFTFRRVVGSCFLFPALCVCV